MRKPFFKECGIHSKMVVLVCLMEKYPSGEKKKRGSEVVCFIYLFSYLFHLTRWRCSFRVNGQSFPAHLLSPSSFSFSLDKIEYHRKWGISMNTNVPTKKEWHHRTIFQFSDRMQQKKKVYHNAYHLSSVGVLGMMVQLSRAEAKSAGAREREKIFHAILLWYLFEWNMWHFGRPIVF